MGSSRSGIASIEVDQHSPVLGRTYDVSTDGQRFLTVKPGETDEDAQPLRINIVLNWFEELKERVPVP